MDEKRKLDKGALDKLFEQIHEQGGKPTQHIVGISSIDYWKDLLRSWSKKEDDD